MGKSYKAAEMAPAKGKLKQSERKMQETPKMKGPLPYERSKRGSRS